MRKFYFKLFWRDLLKNKSHFLLNLLGLTAGITCFLFALLFVFHETSFDAYHANKNRISRVVTSVVSGGNETNTAYSNGFLTTRMPIKFPQIEKMVRFLKLDGKKAIRAKLKKNRSPLENVFYADKDVFSIFSYKVTEGNPASCLTEPNSIVLTSSVAKKLFGNTSAINQVTVLNGKLLKVTAVMNDVPGNSDLNFEGLISMSTLPVADVSDDWMYTYILFTNATAMHTFQPLLNDYAKKVIGPQIGADALTSINYSLQPLESIHFSNNLRFDVPKGNKVYVNIFLAMGILILLIALTNSINMTVVKSFSRTQEVTIHKIYGASRTQLIIQHVIESTIVGLVATVLSFFIVWRLLPAYAVIVNRNLQLADLANWKILASIAGSVILLAICGTIYTGFYLKQVQLADSMRSRNGKIYSLRIVPRFMLGFQFFISIGMIIGAISVYRQVSYLKEKPLGFNQQNVLIIQLPQGEKVASNAKYLKSKLDSDPNISMTALVADKSLPGAFADADLVEYRENGVKVRKVVDDISVDANYFPLLQVPVIKGSGFPDTKDKSAKSMVIVTDLFAKKAGWKNPIGEIIYQGEKDKYTVIGVVPDFHFNSLHNPMSPLIIYNDFDAPASLLVRMNAGKTDLVLKEIQDNWRSAFPDLPFSYSFMDQHLMQQYTDEINLLSLLLTLSSLIIGIGCIGLIAYVSFIVRNSRIDIAIRRILGAELRDVFGLFAKQYAGLLIIAFLAACPVAWYLLDKWLRQFSYHIHPRPVDLFIALGAIVVLVVVVVLYYAVQCIRMSAARVIREN